MDGRTEASERTTVTVTDRKNFEPPSPARYDVFISDASQSLQTTSGMAAFNLSISFHALPQRRAWSEPHRCPDIWNTRCKKESNKPADAVGVGAVATIPLYSDA